MLLLWSFHIFFNFFLFIIFWFWIFFFFNFSVFLVLLMLLIIPFMLTNFKVTFLCSFSVFLSSWVMFFSSWVYPLLSFTTYILWFILYWLLLLHSTCLTGNTCLEIFSKCCSHMFLSFSFWSAHDCSKYLSDKSLYVGPVY